jgi:diaminobutyrate-2-oxoglutarate transaminase
VEAALKLARKVKGRSNVIAFTNGYHGLSAGALAATGNRHFRNEAWINRLNVSFMPFDGYFGPEVDTLVYLRKFLSDQSSGVDIPAAILLETVQAEGGINVARKEWLHGLEAICREFDILLIVDDIQVGNGRTGDYFSFEAAGIRPDMVTLSKAIGALGLPMSLVLIKPEHDQWKPAEHTGTFRGNNLAFVAATAALRKYWTDDGFAQAIRKKEILLRERLEEICEQHAGLRLKVRGRGLVYGLEMPKPELAKAVGRAAFERGLIIELAGSEDQVVKFLPPLVIGEDELAQGLDVVATSIERACALS